MKSGSARPASERSAAARRTALIAALLLMTAIGSMLMRAINVALPAIEEDFDAGYSALQWVLAANFLGLGAFIVIAGRIADARLRAALELGTGLVVGGTIVSALAPTVWLLIAGQAALGLGAGLQISSTFSATMRFTPPDRLGRVLAVRMTIVALSGGAGFLVGGVLIEYLGWRSIFYLALPLLVAAGGAAVALVRSVEHERRPLQVPLVTAVLLALGIGLLMLALNRNRDWGWAPVCLTLVLVSLVALAVFVVRDRGRPDPLVPSSLVTRRQYVGGLVLRSMAFLLFVSFTFFITAFLQNVQAYHPAQVGVLLAPLTLLGVVAAPLSGRVIDRYGPLPSTVVGFAAIGAGLALLVGVDAESSYAERLLPALVLWGAGLTVVMPAAMTAALRTVGPGAGGTASSLVNAAGFLFGALGITVTGFVFGAFAAARFDEALSEQGLHLSSAEHDQLLDLIGTKGVDEDQSHLDLATAMEIDQAARDTFVTAFRWTMAAMLSLVVVGLVACIWLFRGTGEERAPPRRPISLFLPRARVRSVAIVVLAAIAVGVGVVLLDERGERRGGTVPCRELRVYTSLPLAGRSSDVAADLVRAERLALDEAGDRAGPFSVKLVVLNDARIDSGRWSARRVRANANRAASDPRTIAFIGDLDSSASERSLPILNRRGILQVSPGSTAIGLTEEDAADPGSPGEYYPTGERTFARVVQNDQVQAQALLLYMKQHGVNRVFVVHDSQQYGIGLAEELDRFSLRKGVEVVATRGINSDTDLSSLAAEIAESHAEGLLFTGAVPSPAAPLFRAVHEREPSLKLFGSDGLVASEFIADIGRAAAKTRLTAPARRPGTYPASGEHFFSRFERRFGHVPNPLAIYGYEAMRAVLDSIRRAGGDHADRGRVVDAFFAIEDRHSPLGIYSIDANGDTTLAYFGGYQVKDGELVYER